MFATEKILLVQLAGLGSELFERYARKERWHSLEIQSMQTVFPAMTCPVQASVRTGKAPVEHGMYLNGRFHYELGKPLFWEQSSGLFEGERVWEKWRGKGKTVSQLFVQQSLGRDADCVMTPQPIHKHHGGMIQDCYTQPAHLYQTLKKRIGSDFSLFDYWGPLAKGRSSKWIAQATIEMLKDEALRTDLMYVYIPHMDYCQQKYGPWTSQTQKAFAFLEDTVIFPLLRAAKEVNYQVVFFGDYAINPAKKAIYPNQILRKEGLLLPRMIEKYVYPDMWKSSAFAMVDHQLAQVVCFDPEKTTQIAQAFEGVEGIKRCFKTGSKHHHKEDFFLEADAGYWFAYPWWEKDENPPDYATHMDIHNKPGFDPCELFMEFWPPFSISLNTTKVKGTHGNADGKQNEVLLASSFPLGQIDHILTLVRHLFSVSLTS